MPLQQTSGNNTFDAYGVDAKPAVTVTNLGTATGTNAPVITLTNPVPAGSVIFLFGAFAGSAISDITVTSSVSQTWNKSIVTASVFFSPVAKMIGVYSQNSTAMPAGATITVSTTPSSGINSGLITACVINNVSSSAYDSTTYAAASGAENTGNSTVTSSGATQIGEVLIYGFVCNAYYTNPSTFTQTSGWENAPLSAAAGGSTGTLIGGGVKIASATGAFTLTNTTNVATGGNPWGLMVYGFKK
jgi:hypothetical protein